MNTRTEEILSRFEKSWFDTEKFFDRLIDNGNFDKLIPVRTYILELREKGEWKNFRIGTSMHTLIFSRSIDFGLRVDQKSVSIETFGINDYEIVLRDASNLYREYRINDLNDVRLHKLLDTLKGTLVD